MCAKRSAVQLMNLDEHSHHPVGEFATTGGEIDYLSQRSMQCEPSRIEWLWYRPSVGGQYDPSGLCVVYQYVLA